MQTAIPTMHNPDVLIRSMGMQDCFAVHMMAADLQEVYREWLAGAGASGWIAIDRRRLEELFDDLEMMGTCSYWLQPQIMSPDQL